MRTNSNYALRLPASLKRAARADFADFDRLMKRPGGASPRPDDEIPANYRKRKPARKRRA